MNDAGTNWSQAAEQYESALLEAFLNQFPRKPTAPAWYDGNEILVTTEEQADFLADLLESLFSCVCYINTGWYDPAEDCAGGNVPDKYTGWHYVSWD